MIKAKVGQTLYNVQCYDESQSRDQIITLHIDAGELGIDNSVRALNGTLVDFFNEGRWFKSKNEAIDEAIRLLEGLKE